jgi:acyl dehydratase
VSVDESDLAKLRRIRFRPESFLITNHDIAKFARAIGADNPIYFDDAAALSSGRSSIVAPPSYYISLGLTRGRILPRDALGVDGLPISEPLAGAKIMAGETHVRFTGEIRAGDTIDVNQTLRDVYFRDGRNGRLTFMVYRRRYVAKGRGTVVDELYTRFAR